MAEMALGYGSEFQMLRYLGHHRMYLDNKIKLATGSDSPIKWYDYPNDPQRVFLDGEWKGIEFLKDRKDYEVIKSQWKKFWPTSGSAQSWDGVFEQKGILYVVEAKAHIKEMESECHADKAKSQPIILEAFTKTNNGCVVQAQKWIESKHYQLANRLAFLYFCEMVGIEARLCYIMFINGYLENETINVSSVEAFKKAWDDECKALGLSTTQLKKIATVYIDCTKDR